MALTNDLQSWVARKTDPKLTSTSRIHPLTGYLPRNPDTEIHIKREDELNAGVVGSKFRKYLSLLPALRNKGVKKVILIGSAHSNNVMGLAQLLIQEGIAVTAWVKTPGSSELTGNHLFLKLLIGEHNIRYLNHKEWPHAEESARNCAQQEQQKGVQVEVIPEGGDHPDVIPGTLTLALDLLRNEQLSGTCFRDIWTDSGTGVSSIGLLLGLRLLGMTERHLHITLIAGDEGEFRERYQRHQLWLESQLEVPLPEDQPEISFLKPATAPSFGSVNKTLLNETAAIARETGILMDPLYSAKHLYTVKKTMEVEPPIGPQLVLYNGGPLGLCGFQSRLAEAVSKSD